MFEIMVNPSSIIRLGAVRADNLNRSYTYVHYLTLSNINAM